MTERQKSDKFEALARYTAHYDYENLPLLRYPKEDGPFLQEACEKQVAKPVKANKKYAGILYCPCCKRHVRKDYDVYCSGCGNKLNYNSEEIDYVED